MENNEIYSLIERLCNCYCSNRREKFLDAMVRLHPTVQQVFTGLCLAWVNQHAVNRWDERNRASGKVCEQLRFLYGVDTGEDNIRDTFPMV